MSCGPLCLQVGGDGAHFSSKLGALRDHFGSKLDVLGVVLAPSWGSWGLLGDLGPNMAPRRPQERKYSKNQNFFDPVLEAKLEPKSIQNRSEGLPKSSTIFNWFWGLVLVAFGPDLAPNWPPKPSQDRPKFVPKSSKNYIKMLTKCLLDF